MANPSKITSDDVKKVAKIANIPISDEEAGSLTDAFRETLDVISNLEELDTKDVEAAHHTTGLENVVRDDRVDHDQMLSLEAALSNADKTHNNYFVVPPVLNKNNE